MTKTAGDQSGRASVGWPAFCAAGCIGAALLIGLALAARYDLVIDQALLPLWQAAAARHVAGKGSLWYWWAVLAESIGSLPAWAAAPVLGWAMCGGVCAGRVRPDAAARLRITAGVVLAAVGGAVMMQICFDALASRQAAQLAVWLRLLLGGCVGAGVAVWAAWSGAPAAAWQRRRVAALVWAGMSVAQYAVIHILKPIWQRARFDEMLAGGSFADFTVWYRLPGGGGSSFPSGHTGSAGVLLALAAICCICGGSRAAQAGWLCGGYLLAGAVAFGRLLIGRHFLSDTLMALAIDSLLLAVLWFTPLLARLCRMARPAAPADAGPLQGDGRRQP